MLQRIHALLAITQLTTLHNTLQLAVNQLVGQASYAQYPNAGVAGAPMSNIQQLYGQTMAHVDSGISILAKELTPYVTLPSASLHQGRTLGVDEENKVEWSTLNQALLDQAFPQTETSELIDLTDKVLTITNRYAPTAVTLTGLTHIHWDKEIGNSLPYMFTVTDLPERQA